MRGERREVGHFLHLHGLLLTEPFQTAHQGSRAVVGLCIVVAQHIVAFGLVADDAQQVAGIDAAVLLFHHKGGVVGCLHRG